jgi:hypothetical protein
LKCIIEIDGTKKLDIFPNDPDSRSPLNNHDIDPDVNFFAEISWDSPYSTPDSLTSLISTPHLFTTMHLNCRSIINKVTDIIDLLALLPVSVLALTET